VSAEAGRIASAFEAARGATGLIPYLTAGYPSLDATLVMMQRLERAGARAIEIGIPFSDPIADGQEIQRASEWAMRAGVGADETLDVVARFRRGGRLPVVVMTYANPILRRGVESFASDARAAGVDGVLVSDLPPDEIPEAWRAFDAAGLDTIVLVAPTTTPARTVRLLERCRGFVYCLARTGVTGRSGGEAGSLPERIAELRRQTTLPIAVGFGISNPTEASRLKGVADAIVVGAAFMRAVAEHPGQGAAERVERLAADLIAALA